MKKFWTLVALVGISSLSACSNYSAKNEVEALNHIEPVGSPFTQQLANEYREFANRELDQMFDYADARHFARKGIAAAQGDIVLPEPVDSWHLMAPHIQELGTARGRLITSFDLGSRELAPHLSAIAQARYDCWIEQQEENWEQQEILTCKKQFLDAISAVEDRISSAKPVISVSSRADTSYEEGSAMGEEYSDTMNDEQELQIPLRPEDAMYLVFFDFDSHRVGTGGKQVLDAVSDEISGSGLNAVTISGHTDRAGSKAYNEKLAMKRANSVRQGLIDRNVDPRLIRVESRGENNLLVDTRDGVREPANRRVEVTFR